MFYGYLDLFCNKWIIYEFIIFLNLNPGDPVLYSTLFSCGKFSGPKTGENIKIFIKKDLDFLGIDINDIFITTDSGENIKNSLKEHLNLACFCHKLHTTISTTFIQIQKTHTFVQDAIQASNNLVSFVKKVQGVRIYSPSN